MNSCQRYQELISRLVDGEISRDENAALMAHLKTCSSCNAMYAVFHDLSDILSEEPAELPAGLHENIMAEVRRSAMVKKNRRLRRVGLRTALTAAACLVLVLFASRVLNPGERAGQIGIRSEEEALQLLPAATAQIAATPAPAYLPPAPFRSPAPTEPPAATTATPAATLTAAPTPAAAAGRSAEPSAPRQSAQWDVLQHGANDPAWYATPRPSAAPAPTWVPAPETAAPAPTEIGALSALEDTAAPLSLPEAEETEEADTFVSNDAGPLFFADAPEKEASVDAAPANTADGLTASAGTAAREESVRVSGKAGRKKLLDLLAGREDVLPEAELTRTVHVTLVPEDEFGSAEKLEIRIYGDFVFYELGTASGGSVCYRAGCGVRELDTLLRSLAAEAARATPTPTADPFSEAE